MIYMILTTIFYYAVTISQFIKGTCDSRYLKSYLKSIKNSCGRSLSKKKLSYNLRKRPILNLPRIYFTYYGTNAIHFRGSLIWNNLPAKVKSSNSVSNLKPKLKIWEILIADVKFSGKLVLGQYLVYY